MHFVHILSRDKPNLVFFDIIDCAKMGVAVAFSGCPTPQVCVEACPDDYWAWFPLYAEEIALSSVDASGRAEMICKDDVNAVTSSKVHHWLSRSWELTP